MIKARHILSLVLLACSSVGAMEQNPSQLHLADFRVMFLKHHIVSYEHLQLPLLGEASPLAAYGCAAVMAFAQQAVRVHKEIIRRLDKGETFEPSEISEHYPPVFRAILTGQMKPDEKGELWVCSKECDGIGYAHVAFPQCRKLLFEPSTFEKQLTDEVGCLTQLTLLSLAGHRLAGLPDQLSGLANLKYLDLSENEFTEFPPPIRSLAKLRKLWLSGNRIATIPEALGCAATLTHLFLIGNEMQELSPAIGQFVNLKLLCLEQNRLETVPPDIGKLQRLKKLYLHNNDLSALPDEIGQLVELRQFALNGNRELGQLPSTITNLQKLTYLGLPDGLPSPARDELRKQFLKSCDVD